MTFFPTRELNDALILPEGESGVRVDGLVAFSGRPRPVFVAGAPFALQLERLGFFANSLQRFVASTFALCLHRIFGGVLDSASITLPKEWTELLQADIGSSTLYCGSPGPLQKVTMLLPPLQGGSPPVIVKLALRQSADSVIAHEYEILSSIAAAPVSVRGHIPRIVNHGVLSSGRHYLATLAGRGAAAPAQLQQEHLQFMQDLARYTCRNARWRDGAAMTGLRDGFAEVVSDGKISKPVEILLTKTVDRIDLQLGDKVIPQILSHGDFTRYNIRQNRDQFVVFDWEYGKYDANPIADLMHYHLSQPGNWSHQTIIQHALALAEQYSRDCFAEWCPTPGDMAALALHGMMDTLVFYARASVELETDSFLVRRYLALLESVPNWGGLR